jgi:hypothetical protein
MVKLIKLNNDTDSGYFTSQFSDIINIEPDSQVALVNSTFSMGLNNIAIDSSNNTLSFNRKSNEGLMNVTLDEGNYTQTALLQEMRTKINSAQTLLTTGGTTNGFDINPSVNTDGKFALTFGKTDQIQVVDTNSKVEKMTYAADVFTATGASGANFNYDKHVMADKRFNNGSGEAFCIVSDNGFFGLFADPLNGTIVEADIKYGLMFDTGTYYSVVDGSKTSLAVVPDFNKVLSIELKEGELTFSEDTDVLFETGYDYNTPGYYIGAGVQKNAEEIESFFYNPDAFTTTWETTANIDAVIHNDNDVYEIFSLGAIAATVFQMTLNSDLALKLGFTRTILRASAIQKTFTAINKFKDSNLSESIEVHLINVGEIKSYDSVSTGVQRIVGIIPIGSAIVGNKVSYSVPDLLYVDFNNKFVIPVSTLTIRLLGASSGEEIIFEGGINLVLAIKPRSETK